MDQNLFQLSMFTLTIISFRFLFAVVAKDQNISGISDDNYCSNNRVCGANSNCDVTKGTACVCLDGFKLKSISGWDPADYTQGCVRDKALNCSTDHVFTKYSVYQEPSGTFYLLNQSLTEEDCRERCLSNCSCVAFSFGSGCKLWNGDLFDVRGVKEGKDLYIRMQASVQDPEEETHGHNERIIVGVIIGSTIAIISGIIFCCCYLHRRRSRLRGNIRTSEMVGHIDEEAKGDLELPLFDLSRIAMATDNFSVNNKLGEGGFGPVYKGTLHDGRQIAVKRLSRSSGQGLNEFKNEVILIAKLRHRNLVKLIGCCIQGEEKLLIYEYMPNRSLDYFIFDKIRGKLLDWPKRFNIICGIARGLLYLHQDSRLRIIHRDLKASNVLLDNEMVPKISDFGLAKSFDGGDQSRGNTNRIMGTFGYMAPEYAVNGQFSVKSDVFSFGILVLEIVAGEKNRRLYQPNDDVYLYGHAWSLWEQGRPLELVDECLKNSWSLSEVQRCIHIGLLCAQQHPQDRPSMSSVVLMLGSEIDLPQPKFPSVFVGEPYDGLSSSDSKNKLSITDVEPR